MMTAPIVKRRPMTKAVAQEQIAGILKKHGFEFDDLLANRRADKLQVACRNHCMWELRRLGWSLPRIAWVFNRDHTTVIYGIGMHLYDRGERHLYPEAVASMQARRQRASDRKRLFADAAQ